jgi:predicted Kef-type K+ transport protein
VRYALLSTIAAGLLQATSLGFIVVGAQIGMELGKLSEATGAAMIAAGLLSVLLFPILALTALRGGAGADTQPEHPEAASERLAARSEFAM